MGKKREKRAIPVIDLLLPLLLFVVTAFIYIPCSMYFGNIDEFSVGFSRFFAVVIVPAVGIFVLVALLQILLRSQRRLSYVIVDLLFGISLGIYIQINFLNGMLSKLNGTEMVWDYKSTECIVSSAVWALCIILPQIARLLFDRVEDKIAKYGSALLSVMQIASLVIMLFSTTRSVSNDFYISKHNEFALSEKKNEVVFVVDTLDAQWAEDYIVNNPDYAEKLEGFTYFDNVVSEGAPTILGMRVMLGGSIYDPYTSISDYFSTAYDQSTLFKDLKDNGYGVRLYTNQNYLNNADFENIENALTDCEYKFASNTDFICDLYKLIAYTAMPYPLKSGFEIYSGVLTDNAMIADPQDENMIIDDAVFYQDFLKHGLTLTDKENAFVLYHLFGAHGPYSLTADAERVDEGDVSRKEQIEGVMKIIFDYLEAMERLGVYDDSRIIITADHGGLALYQNPAVFIKPSNSEGELKTNSAPLTFHNLRATFVDGIVENYRDTYGANMFEVPEDADVGYRIHTFDTTLYKNVWDDAESVDKDFYQYQIGNPARDNSKIIKSPPWAN